MQDVQRITHSPTMPPMTEGAPAEHELLPVIRKLPNGSELILNDQTWPDYIRLIDAVIDSPVVRIAFDGNSLQITTLSVTHDTYVRLLESMIRSLSRVLEIDVQSIGSATIKQALVKRGVEPDGCYYIQNIDVATGRMEIDFEVEPMPDLAVEIDVYNATLKKLPIYAALGFPEIWRFYKKTFEFYKLDNGAYIKIDQSVAFPTVTSADLLPFILRAPSERQSSILRDFEVWLNSRGTKPA